MMHNIDTLRVVCEFTAVMLMLPFCIMLKIRWFDAIRNKGQRSTIMLTKESFLYATLIATLVLGFVVFFNQAHL
jgi:integral membrane sensor domain MASE1